MQVAERRIAGAKVVDAQLHAQTFQTRQQLHGHLSVVHHGAFSDLELQMPGFDMSLFENVLDLINQSRLCDLFA